MYIMGRSLTQDLCVRTRTYAYALAANKSVDINEWAVTWRGCGRLTLN